MSTRRQTPNELKAHLEEQLGFLEASASAYDSGTESEAKRLATTIRVLVHETNASHSLLGQLGQLSSTSFFDSAFPNFPGNLSSYSGLVVTAHITGGSKYLPLLDDHQMGPGEWVSFSSWWNCVVFVDDQKRQITRKDLILAIANQDGGAHVDPSVNAKYAGLSRENSLGWFNTKGGESRPEDPPHLAAVRQVAHEVLKTLRPGYSKNGPKIEALMYTAAISVSDTIPQIMPAFMGRPLIQPARLMPKIGRNDPCPCGSGKKFKKCHGAVAR